MWEGGGKRGKTFHKRGEERKKKEKEKRLQQIYRITTTKLSSRSPDGKKSQEGRGEKAASANNQCTIRHH